MLLYRFCSMCCLCAYTTVVLPYTQLGGGEGVASPNVHGARFFQLSWVCEQARFFNPPPPPPPTPRWWQLVKKRRCFTDKLLKVLVHKVVIIINQAIFFYRRSTQVRYIRIPYTPYISAKTGFKALLPGWSRYRHSQHAHCTHFLSRAFFYCKKG
jgi:hypothetical protein